MNLLQNDENKNPNPHTFHKILGSAFKSKNFSLNNKLNKFESRTPLKLRINKFNDNKIFIDKIKNFSLLTTTVFSQLNPADVYYNNYNKFSNLQENFDFLIEKKIISENESLPKFKFNFMILMK